MIIIMKIALGREPLNPRAYEATLEHQYNDIFAYTDNEEIRKTTTVLVSTIDYGLWLPLCIIGFRRNTSTSRYQMVSQEREWPVNGKIFIQCRLGQKKSVVL